MHTEQNLLFISVVGTTSWSQGADVVVLLYILAHSATEAYFMACCWTPFTQAGQYSAHRGQFNNRYSTRVSLALCLCLGGSTLAQTSVHDDGTANIDDHLEFVPEPVPAVGRQLRGKLLGASDTAHLHSAPSVTSSCSWSLRHPVYSKASFSLITQPFGRTPCSTAQLAHSILLE